MDGVEAVCFRVVGVVVLAAGEVLMLLPGGDLPGEQARGDGEDLVALGAAVERHGEGEHRLVLTRGVVGEGEAIGHRLADGVRGVAAVLGRLLAEEAGVATRHVTGAHDVAEHHDVLRLGDDGLGAERQTKEGRELVGMSIVPHGRSASCESAFAYWQV